MIFCYSECAIFNICDIVDSLIESLDAFWKAAEYANRFCV